MTGTSPFSAQKGGYSKLVGSLCQSVWEETMLEGFTCKRAYRPCNFSAQQDSVHVQACAINRHAVPRLLHLLTCDRRVCLQSCEAMWRDLHGSSGQGLCRVHHTEEGRPELQCSKGSSTAAAATQQSQQDSNRRSSLQDVAAHSTA